MVKEHIIKLKEEDLKRKVLKGCKGKLSIRPED